MLRMGQAVLDAAPVLTGSGAAVVPRGAAGTTTQTVPVGDDMAGLRMTLAAMVNASGQSQREISRRMGAKGNTINQYLMGRAMSHPSFGWVSRLVFACGGRIWVEYPKR